MNRSSQGQHHAPQAGPNIEAYERLAECLANLVRWTSSSVTRAQYVIDVVAGLQVAFSDMGDHEFGVCLQGLALQTENASIPKNTPEIREESSAKQRRRA